MLAPLIRGQKGEYRDLFEDLLKQGFVRARVDGRVVRLTDDLRLDRQMRHNIEVVVDRLVAGPKIRPRLAEAVELALRLGEGNLIVAVESDEDGRSGKGAEDAKAEGGRGMPTELMIGRQPSAFLRLRLPPSDLSLSAHYACTHCQNELRAAQPAVVQLQQSAGDVSGVQRAGADLHVRSRAADSRSEPLVSAGLHRAVGQMAGDGPLAAAHLPRRGRNAGAEVRASRRARVLETAWEELDERVRHALLWGTGDEHITFTWRGGASGYKWGGPFEGIIPKLLAQYRTTRSRPQRRQLEKYMRDPRLRALPRPAAERPGLRGDRHHARAKLRRLPAANSRCRRSARLAVSDAAEFFSRPGAGRHRRRRSPPRRSRKSAAGCSSSRTSGLEYLTLDRTAPTLSGGEMQRIRLAGQIGCGLVGVLYILDEPSIGLHPRDNDTLLETLAQLRDQGNTVVVVEHDEDTMRAADHIVDFGPGPGVRGGHVVAAGSLDDVIAEPKSLTGQYLSGRRRIEIPARRRDRNGDAKLVDPRRRAQQPQEHRRRDPAGRVRLRDRRFRLGQELAGQRHPGRGPAPRSQRRPRQSGRASTRSKASSISTR